MWAVPRDVVGVVLLTGSPFRVDVTNPAQVNVVGAGSQLMPVNVPAWFEIRGAVACADGDLIVNITCQSFTYTRRFPYLFN